MDHEYQLTSLSTEKNRQHLRIRRQDKHRTKPSLQTAKCDDVRQKLEDTSSSNKSSEKNENHEDGTSLTSEGREETSCHQSQETTPIRHEKTVRGK